VEGAEEGAPQHLCAAEPAPRRNFVEAGGGLLQRATGRFQAELLDRLPGSDPQLLAEDARQMSRALADALGEAGTDRSVAGCSAAQATSSRTEGVSAACSRSGALYWL